MARQKAEAEGLPRGRQAQVAHLAARGLKNDEIAEHLGIKPTTVCVYFKRAMQAEGVTTRTALVAVRLRNRVVRLKALVRQLRLRIEGLETEVGRLRGGTGTEGGAEARPR